MAKDDKTQKLAGSTTLPAEIDVGGKSPAWIADVVAAAFAASGKTEDDWNTMPDADRDALIEAEVGRLREENGFADEADEAEEPAESDEVAALRAEFKAMMKSEVEALAPFIQAVVDEKVAALAAKVPQLAGSAAEAFEKRLDLVEVRLRNFVH